MMRRLRRLVLVLAVLVVVGLGAGFAVFALRGRGIETGRFPTAEFELTGPFALSREPVPARGRLTLHGETQAIVARVSGQRDGADAIELAGSAPIAFADFGIEPPSVAGFVTVRDTGRLEFQLRLRPR